MQKIFGSKISREDLAHILGLSTIFSLGGAILFERLGIRSHKLSPLAFVGISLALMAIIFVAWPLFQSRIHRMTQSILAHPSLRSRLEALGVATATNGRSHNGVKKDFFSSPGATSQGADRRRQHLRSENDPRLSAAVFSANVPTFVLDADQRFVEWNIAFELAFKGIQGIRRGAHISKWFSALDNFKRIPKRSDHLYGEAILPMADRERVSFISESWGRMVFIKFMTPILDRSHGKIIGWTVVLNINSVSHRVEFFEALYAAIAAETRKRFFAACYDGIFGQDSVRRNLLAMHTSNLGPAKRVLDLGAMTGDLTCRLAREGRMVTCVESDVHLLRRIFDKTAALGPRVRIVKQSVTDLKGLPTNRFDGVTMLLTVNRLADPVALLRKIRTSMQDGAILTMSAIVGPYEVETVYNAVRHEMSERGRFEALRDQFNHVLEHERHESRTLPYHYRSAKDLERIAEDAGFTVERSILQRLGSDQEEAIVLLVLKNQR